MQKIKLCNLTTWRNITIRISFPYNINNRKKHCKDNNEDYIPQLHQIGCMGKITTFKETEHGRYLI